MQKEKDEEKGKKRKQDQKKRSLRDETKKETPKKNSPREKDGEKGKKKKQDQKKISFKEENSQKWEKHSSDKNTNSEYTKEAQEQKKREYGRKRNATDPVFVGKNNNTHNSKFGEFVEDVMDDYVVTRSSLSDCLPLRISVDPLPSQNTHQTNSHNEDYFKNNNTTDTNTSTNTKINTSTNSNTNSNPENDSNLSYYQRLLLENEQHRNNKIPRYQISILEQPNATNSAENSPTSRKKTLQLSPANSKFLIPETTQQQPTSASQNEVQTQQLDGESSIYSDYCRVQDNPVIYTSLPFVPISASPNDHQANQKTKKRASTSTAAVVSPSEKEMKGSKKEKRHAKRETFQKKESGKKVGNRKEKQEKLRSLNHFELPIKTKTKNDTELDDPKDKEIDSPKEKTVEYDEETSRTGPIAVIIDSDDFLSSSDKLLSEDESSEHEKYEDDEFWEKAYPPSHKTKVWIENLEECRSTIVNQIKKENPDLDSVVISMLNESWDICQSLLRKDFDVIEELQDSAYNYYRDHSFSTLPKTFSDEFKEINNVSSASSENGVIDISKCRSFGGKAIKETTLLELADRKKCHKIQDTLEKIKQKKRKLQQKGSLSSQELNARRLNRSSSQGSLEDKRSFRHHFTPREKRSKGFGDF